MKHDVYVEVSYSPFFENVISYNTFKDIETGANPVQNDIIKMIESTVENYPDLVTVWVRHSYVDEKGEDHIKVEAYGLKWVLYGSPFTPIVNGVK